MIDLKLIRRMNAPVAVCAVAIFATGLLFIYSGSYQLRRDSAGVFVHRQAAWGIAGLCVAVFLALFDYRKLAGVAYLLYGLFMLSLIAVLLAADPRRGAQSWFTLGAFAVQPSEFAKVGLIIALARYLSAEDVSRKTISFTAGALGLALLPLALILKQPDLGTALTLLPVMLALFLVAGINRIYLGGLILAGILSLPLGWMMLKPYQQARIKVFLNPQLDPLRTGYNAIQSVIAVGSGGLWGRGLLQGTQTHLRFLPERHTDFIFCVLGEEAGFAGCLLLIALYAIVVVNGLRIAEQSRDEFGRLLAVGITVLLASHVIINVGMTIGLLPITGLPLPLMSYGGSSLISTCICLGILQSICARRYIF